MLVAILIVIGLCFGVYAVLPQTSKMFVKGNIQYRTDDTAKAQVDKIKKTKIPGFDKTFGDGLENLCKSSAWYYEEEASGDWKVTYYGSKATMDLTTAGMDHSAAVTSACILPRIRIITLTISSRAASRSMRFFSETS